MNGWTSSASWEEAETGWKSKARRSHREKVRREKMQAREKVGKSRNTVFFQCFVAPEGRKVGSLKRRVQSQLARGEMQKRTRQAHLEVKMHNHTMFGPPLEVAMWEKCTRSTFGSQNAQSHHVWTTFGSCDVQTCTNLWREAHLEVKMCKTWDVEQVHGVVARSTFKSENVQNTKCSGHLWTSRFQLSSWCRKSARLCVAKHICKSKVLKTVGLEPILMCQMSLFWQIDGYRNR